MRFEQLKKLAKEKWGLSLYRNTKESRGYWKGCWKSGYTLSGNFPGLGNTCRRYSTLKEVAKALGAGP